MSNGEYISYQAGSSEVINTDHALDLWLQCVQLQSSGLFSYVSEGPNFDYFDIRLIHRGGGGPYEIFDVNKEQNISCKHGDDVFNPTTQVPVKISQADYMFRCSKPGSLKTTVSLNTSEGSTGTINIVGTELSQADLRKLQADVDFLQQQSKQQDASMRQLRNAVQNQKLNPKQDTVKIPATEANGVATVQGRCQAGTILVSYYCQIDKGGGLLQNIGGTDGSSFSCTWTSVSKNKDGEFSAWGQPVCASLTE